MASVDPVHIGPTMGSMLIGTIVSAMLLGVTYIQSFYYFLDYPTDPWYMKSLVACTVAFDTIHMSMISHTVYHYLVSNYNNPPALEDLVWSVLLEALFTGMTGFLVQFFFTIRVWRLSKSFLLTGIILLIVVANAGCGTAWVIISMQMRTYIDLLTISPLTISINALSAGGDVLIAGSLVVLLRRARTGFKKSDTTINRLIVFIVNTGVLTSCIAIAALISITASPKTLIYASFYFCIGRFYANSLLATLNARKHIAGWNDDASHMLVSMPPSVVNSSGGKVQPNISIRIETTQRCDGLEAQSHQGHDKSCDGLSKQKAPALEAWH